MKKAFLISYRFPPQGGGGVQRTLKYTRYLRDFGWEPVVHTARNPFWDVWDESLLAEIPPNVEVCKTSTFEIEKVENAIRDGIRAIRGGRSAAGNSEVKGSPAHSDSVTPVRKAGARGRLGQLNEFLHKRLMIPDQQIFWVLPALWAGIREVRRTQATLIHTSSPPNSLHLYGGLLARSTGLPWVADFRDPWTDGPRRRRNYVNNRLREKIEKAMERWVVRNADHVVVTAPPLRDRFLKKYPFLDEGDISVITNGYDVHDFQAASDLPKKMLPRDGFHLTGTGNIENMFPAEHLFGAIASACAKHEGLRRDLSVHLVGAKRGPYDQLLADLGLEDRVRYEGWVPHVESIRYLQESSALLMCMIPQAGGGNEKLSGKGFEYLFTRKPFLCLAKPGLTADLFSQTDLAHIVDPHDAAGIERELIALYEARAEDPVANEDLVRKFDRKNLTGELATIFDGLIAADDGARGAGTREVAA
jgi:glycosyltransferase involved in cell wall biosynthesis